MIKDKEERDLFKYERELAKDYKYICGVDEVGRGPLAGPVCVCAAIMDLENIVEGVDDSKKLSEKKRESIYSDIIKNTVSYKTVYIENEEIDEINILNATKKAMKAAVEGLEKKADFVLIDAVKIPLEAKSLSIIKGDANSYSIACASIIAKVERDRLMQKYHNEFPEYGFDKNKGYGTKVHIEALQKFGATRIHRKSFIKNFINGENDDKH